MAKFKKGDTVNRMEEGEGAGATVSEVMPDGYYRIEYDEGGEGIWPEDALMKPGP